MVLKMMMTGYKDSGYMMPAGMPFFVQINPSSINIERGIGYNKDKTAGTQYAHMKYASHQEEKLSFKIVLDSTGAVGDLPVPIPVPVLIEELCKVLYTLNGDTHEPNYVVVSWGTISFKGRLTSMKEEYTLFSPLGIPLRVNISLSFASHTDKQEGNKKENKSSPGLSTMITLKAGETIAFWCNRLYGDASYCMDIARYNGLSGFRNVKPGTTLLFPPLKRYGKLSG
ncbi:MAG: phage tail protein [Tannerellaceae bacterium]|nr:phage tail protein [Tannerellaceae bacterium]